MNAITLVTLIAEMLTKSSWNIRALKKANFQDVIKVSAVCKESKFICQGKLISCVNIFF